MNGAPVLIAENLTVARGKRRLLEGLNLTLRRGEVTVILGPNGVGKSTLLSVLASLLPHPEGKLTLNGRVAAALQSPSLARRSVRSNVELALDWWGVPAAERTERALNALSVIGIGHLADRMADTLSGGEARRVHFARALALESDALLLDEPFAGLDPPTRAELLSDTATALRDADRATLVIVHDRAEAWALADRLIVLLDGGIAAEGTPHEVLENPPAPEVADFLGFTGRIREGFDAVRYVRPAQLTLNPAGRLLGTVIGRLPEEDSVLCDVVLTNGGVQVRSPYPGPQIDDVVGLDVDGGVRFKLEVPASTT